jgi:RND family efflux transporter MFP subunit
MVTFKKEISVIGQIAQDAETSVHVSSSVNGEILSMKAHIGSIVTKGDILCTISKINGETVLYDVRSPITGIVIGAFAKDKDRVDAVSSIFTIADLTKLWANFDVYEKDIADIKIGQKVILYSVAYPDKMFDGEIVFISPRVDESSHTIKIRAIVDNKDLMLKLGMFISGKIISESNEKYLSVPAHAIQDLRNKKVIFLKTSDQRFEKKEIKIKSETKDQAFIENISSQEKNAPIKEGDEVVIEGAFLLKSELLKDELEGE